MRAKWAPTCILLAMAASGAMAQTHPGTPDMTSMYCSGIITPDSVPSDRYIISGEDSAIRITYRMHDSVLINMGSDHNLHAGDELSVVRPVKSDPLDQEWFKGQFMMVRSMGTYWEDMGRVRVTKVGPKVSAGEVEFACSPMERGDIVLPFAERPAPTVKVEPFKEKFEFSGGKEKTGTIVARNGWGELLGTNNIGYINIGANDGLKVGSYVRVFRFAGPANTLVPQEPDSQYQMYGFGTAPAKFSKDELPREVIGEAVVLRVSGRTATVMVTAMRRDIFAGDYVEIEQ